VFDFADRGSVVAAIKVSQVQEVLSDCSRCRYLEDLSISQHNQICKRLETAKEISPADDPSSEHLVIETDLKLGSGHSMPSEITVRLPNAEVDEIEAEHLKLAVYSLNQKMKVLQLIQQEAKLLIDGHKNSQNQLKELQDSISETTEQMRVLFAKQGQTQDRLKEGTRARLEETKELEGTNRAKAANIGKLEAAIQSTKKRSQEISASTQDYSTVKIRIRQNREALDKELKLRKDLHEDCTQSRAAFKAKVAALLSSYQQTTEEKHRVYEQLLATRAEVNAASQQFDRVRREHQMLSGQYQKLLGQLDLENDDLSFRKQKLRLAEEFQGLCESLEKITADAETVFEDRLRSVDELNAEISHSSQEVKVVMQQVTNQIEVRNDVQAGLIQLRDSLLQKNQTLQKSLGKPVPEAPADDGADAKDLLINEMSAAADVMINQVRRHILVHRVETSLTELIGNKDAEILRLKSLISQQTRRHAQQVGHFDESRTEGRSPGRASTRSPVRSPTKARA
jgi:chromosome segregation ATPase